MANSMRSEQFDPQSLIEQLDLESKITLLTGAAMFALQGEPRIALSPMKFSDGPTGVRGEDFLGGRTVSLLPNATLLASSWDPETLAEVGRILAEEAKRQGVSVVLGPTVNLHRTPLGGRLFEAYSEDPLLTGMLAAAYISGIQSEGVGACVKHLVANESETDRLVMNSVLSAKTLREVYLLPFMIAVQEANPWTVMNSYNSINGITATENGELNNQILKGEWRYEGLLMSDWDAARSAAPAANGGLDLVMPGPDGPWGDALVQAVRRGKVAEATINDHLGRLLTLAHRAGALDAEGEALPEHQNMPEPDSAERREQLRQLAAANMSVLKNSTFDGAPTLPLPAQHRNGSAPLWLVGRHASHTVAQGGGSAMVFAPHEIPILAALSERGAVDFIGGVAVRNTADVSRADSLRDPHTGELGIAVTSFRADGARLATSHSPRAETLLGTGGTEHEECTELELSAELVLDPQSPAPEQVRLGVRGAGDWTISYGDSTITASTRYTSGDPGEAILTPPAFIVNARFQPGATVSARVRRIDMGLLRAGLIAEPATPSLSAVQQAIGERIGPEATAVVVVGLTDEQETEGRDKTTLALPGDQDAMIRAVAAAAARTVVVVNAATPVLMPWLDEVDAVLWAGLPGQEAGDAVADALFGVIEPAGRLATTFPAHDGEGPAWEVTPTHGELNYVEGTGVGYRGWAELATQPLFWFGAGEGYSTWDYLSAELSEGGVSVQVRNAGARTSSEVVQVYAEVLGEPTRLVGFTRTQQIPAGQTATIRVGIDDRALHAWDESAGEFQPMRVTEYLLARGLGDVRLRLRA